MAEHRLLRVAARAIHFGACLLIVCFCIIELWIIKPRDGGASELKIAGAVWAGR